MLARLLKRQQQGNSAAALIESENARALERIRKFRADYAIGRASFDDFSHLKHQFPYFGFVPCHAGGIDFVLFHANDDIVAWEYSWFGPDYYEREIVVTWLEWCRDPGLVYDIGGYTGLMSVLAALANRGTQVHLIEPMDRTIERAKINVRANRVDQRVKLHNKAASNKNGEAEIKLYREENFLGTGNSIYDKGLKVHDVKKIQCVTVDGYLRDLNPSVVKIDVEGHEQACIEGMRATIERARPKMIVEIWEHTRADVLALLADLGYSCSPFEAKERRVMNFQCTPL